MLSVDEYEICSPVFERPSGENAIKNDDIMVVYFTSGTSSNPKMVAHTYTYPLGHIVTAKYWQHVVDGGRHLTVAETGWAKALWGKIYGQWIAGLGKNLWSVDCGICRVHLRHEGIHSG